EKFIMCACLGVLTICYTFLFTVHLTHGRLTAENVFFIASKCNNNSGLKMVEDITMRPARFTSAFLVICNDGANFEYKVPEK
ncbi:MAG: hypothetical protein JWP44_5033, partial [Mucilaginibacter sp.]|nr:hypothetical protein [Mucilaginibacter sp.]